MFIPVSMITISDWWLKLDISARRHKNKYPQYELISQKTHYMNLNEMPTFKRHLSLQWQIIQHVNESLSVNIYTPRLTLDAFLFCFSVTGIDVKPSSFILTCTFAPIRALWDVWVGGSINSDGPIRDPGLVNTSFHPLHDKIQQDVHSLVDVLPVCSTCLKVWDSARKKMRKG